MMKHHRHAFTLTELLVVIAIIGLTLSLGFYGWHALIGSNSVESAQNIVAGYVAQSREAAVATRQTRGVVFYHDAGLDRVVMGRVYHDNPAVRPPQLDSVPDSDVRPLPQGIGALFDDANGNRLSLPGMLLFDANGQVLLQAYSVRSAGTLGQRLGLSSDTTGFTAIGFTLFVAARYESQTPANRSAWLAAHGRALLLNRYNGGFVQGEY